MTHHWVCLKMSSVAHCTQSGFADYYPVFQWLFHWEYSQHFQTNPLLKGFNTGWASPSDSVQLR